MTFYGLPGDVVRLIEPHTEADLVSLLVQVLCAFGVAVGPKPHLYVDGTDHSRYRFVLRPHSIIFLE